MAQIPTPHIEATDASQIAKTVLMPGDPLRAKYVAEHYLDEGSITQFNGIRSMFGFTGTYHGAPVSVMGSGMGMPSIGIYSYELFKFYDVDSIVRIGTAGGLGENVRLRDLVIGMGACTDSNFAAQFRMPGTLAPIADFELLRSTTRIADQLGYSYHVGNILSSTAFYNDDETASKRWASMGVLAVEMEAAALYLNAMRLRKRALCLLTISDLPFTGESLPAMDRQETFTQMMEVALELAAQNER